MSLISWVSTLFKKLLPAAQPAEPTSQRVEKSYTTFDERYEDTGVFQYNSEGFSISTEKFTETIKWQDITKLNVYKVDMLTIDQIEMEIEYNNGNDGIRITEELPGWYQFVLKTKEISFSPGCPHIEEFLADVSRRGLCVLHSQGFSFNLGLVHSLKKFRE